MATELQNGQFERLIITEDAQMYMEQQTADGLGGGMNFPGNDDGSFNMPEVPHSANRTPLLAVLTTLFGGSAVAGFEAVTGFLHNMFGFEVNDKTQYILIGLVGLFFVAKVPLINFWNQISKNRHELKIETMKNYATKGIQNVKW